MTYRKPPGISYVQMCIYIDKNIHNPNKNENLIYEYIYHICYVLACKGKYFRHFEDYDDFALFAATKVYMRMIDPRQFDPKPDERKLEPVKSVLNYIKLTLYGMKVDYQKQNFNQIIDPSLDERINPEAISNTLKDYVQADYSHGLQEAILEQVISLPSIINDVIDKTPYKKDKLMRKRLYLSCLITFLKSVTLSNANKCKIEKRKEKNNLTDEFLFKIYQQEKDESATLWHLDSSMRDYIIVLVNIIRKEFSKKIIDTKKSFELPDYIVESILMSAYEKYSGGDDIE